MSHSKQIKEISLAELKQRVIRSDFEVLRLNEHLNVQLLRDRAFKAIDRFPPQTKDGYTDYLGLGLQYSDDSDPIYDAVQQMHFISPKGDLKVFREPRFFSKFNDIGKLFPELFDLIRSLIRPTKSRILIAKPGFKMAPHQDGAQCATLHLAIQTAPGAKFFVEDREYHIPSDGHLYVVNVGRTHHVENHSDIDRIHITVPLTPFSFRHWTQELALELKPYAEMYGYKFEPMVEFLLSLDPSVDHIERPTPKLNP